MIKKEEWLEKGIQLKHNLCEYHAGGGTNWDIDCECRSRYILPCERRRK